MLNEQTNSHAGIRSVGKPELTGEPDFTAPPKPIAEVVTRPDFPEGIVGEHLDIGGYTGVVTAVVNKQSIKVRSPEGATRSFNSHNLRRIYGPPPEHEPIASPAAVEPPPMAKPAPKPEIIEEPNFDQPAVPIKELVARLNFPDCAFGKLVEISDFSGVVVQIVNQSLKVRARSGISRSYNAAGLRKIYGSK